MKTREKEKIKKYFQTFVNITFTFGMKLSVEGDADEWDAKYRAEEILDDLIANGEIIVANGDTAAVYGQITDEEIFLNGKLVYRRAGETRLAFRFAFQINLKGSAMLALTRKPGEAILIGDNVVVYVKEIKGKQVKLAIEAPRDVEIPRAKENEE